MTKEDSGKSAAGVSQDVRRKRTETIATLGLLLVAVGLLAPFMRMEDESFTRVFKWIYTAGALTYLVARVVDVCLSKSDSLGGASPQKA